MKKSKRLLLLLFLMIFSITFTTAIITPDIDASRTTCVAPCAIFFDATATDDDTIIEDFHELGFSWDFGDTNPGNWWNGKDKNIDIGPLAAHVYETSGTYTTTLTVKNLAGDVVTKTSTITVQDQDEFYESTGTTYCVSGEGDFNDCPTDSVELTTDSWNKVSYCYICGCPGCNRPNSWREGCLDFRPEVQPTLARRVLLRADETFTADSVVFNQCKDDLYIGSYGTGAKPVIYNEGIGASFQLSRLNGVTIDGIEFRGTYDAATGTGNRTPGIYSKNEVYNLLVKDSIFTGHSLTFDTRAYGTNTEYHFLYDNSISNWLDYGVFGGVVKGFAIIGNSIKQNPEAISANDGKYGVSCSGTRRPCPFDYPDHGPMRLTGDGSNTIVSHNDLLSLNGWSSDGRGIQSAIRNTGNRNYVLIQDNRMEGGLGVASAIYPHSGDTEAAIKNSIWDSNYLIAGDLTDEFFATMYATTTFRNNIMLNKPEGLRFPGYGTSGVDSVIHFVWVQGTNHYTDLNRIYNNHFVNLEAPEFNGYDPYFLNVQGNDNVYAAYKHKIRNNLIYSPGMTQVVRYFSPVPHEIDSDKNLFDAAVTLLTGQDTNTLISTNPKLKNLPTQCDPLYKEVRTLSGVTITGDGLRTYLTKAGQDFENERVITGSEPRLNVLSGTSPANFDCNFSGEADSNYNQCGWDVVVDVTGDTITLALDLTHNQGTDIGTIKYAALPSTKTRLYLHDTGGYEVGEKITYNLGTTGYTITNIGSDAISGYIDIESSLPELPKGFICEWPTTDYVLDLRLETDSPAKDAGQTVAAYEDFTGATRWGTAYEIGAFSDGAGAPSFPVCGDGIIEGNEQCDDGNIIDNDGCSSICTIEVEQTCGNGIREGNEECDDGNLIDNDGCSSTCQTELPQGTCGDTIINEGEECDDGNILDNDGCSSICIGEGLPRNLYDQFDGTTTNLRIRLLTNIQNMILEKITYGKIKFLENINLRQTANLNNNVKILQNHIEIDTTALTELDTSLELSFKTNYNSPIIYKDGNLCQQEECELISYNNGIAKYNITNNDTNSSGGPGGPVASPNTGGTGSWWNPFN